MAAKRGGTSWLLPHRSVGQLSGAVITVYGHANTHTHTHLQAQLLPDWIAYFGQEPVGKWEAQAKGSRAAHRKHLLNKREEGQKEQELVY